MEWYNMELSYVRYMISKRKSNIFVSFHVILNHIISSCNIIPSNIVSKNITLSCQILWYLNMIFSIAIQCTFAWAKSRNKCDATFSHENKFPYKIIITMIFSSDLFLFKFDNIICWIVFDLFPKITMHFSQFFIFYFLLIIFHFSFSNFISYFLSHRSYSHFSQPALLVLFKSK